jgi:Planctomycete cytochrome C
MKAKPTLRGCAVALGAMLAAGGCGVEEDERPLDLQYIVTTILAPSCGTAACHSSRIKTAGVAFDTLEATREAFNSDALVIEGEPDASGLYFLLVGETEPDERMPKDAPLPDADIELIRRWIAAGAEGWR